MTFVSGPTHILVTILLAIATIGFSFLPQSGGAQAAGSYPIVDTGQTTCYDDSGVITCPAEGEAFYGQDAQFTGNPPSYTDNGDGTVTDNVTGLIWQQSPDTDGDGDIDAADKLSYDERRRLLRKPDLWPATTTGSCPPSRSSTR